MGLIMLTDLAKADDFYKILGLERDAKSEAIKVAYKKKQKELNPDNHPGDEEKAE